MSTVYSNGNVKTKLLEPTTYNSNVSAEWRITEPCLPTLRLIDLGTSVSSADSDYNKLIGAYGLIKSVFLYQGQLLLDGCPNIQHFMAFKQYNKSNSINRNLKQHLVRNKMGFGISQINTIADTRGPTNQSGTNASKTALGHVHLNEFLPLLDKLNVLDPAVFKNLRLVVEFTADSQTFATTPPATFTTARPRLIMDVLAPGAFNANPTAVQWNALEQDRFVSPAIAKTAVQSIVSNFKLNGFNSKLVSRILICKSYQDKTKNVDGATVNGFGPFASLAQFKEVVQVAVNGSQLLPRNGVEGPHRMLSMLHDTWGECNTLPGGSSCDLVTTQQADPDTKIATPLLKYQGQQSYFGCFLNQRVKDLQITYTRQGQIDTGAITPYNEALDCLVYGEVSKTLYIQGNVINIVYN